MNVAHFSRDMHHHHGVPVPLSIAAPYEPLDQLQQICDVQIAAIRRFAGLDHSRWIVEVGCGFGQRAIPLIDQLRMDARYLGIDRSDEAIRWAQNTVSPASPNFSFDCMDLGVEGPALAKLPVEENSQDLVIVATTFTDIWPEPLAQCLKEFARVLRPGGIVYAGFYVIRPGLIEYLNRHGSTDDRDLTFMDMVERGFYLEDPGLPHAPKGYSPRRLGTLARRARMVPTRFIKGGWAGDGHNEIDGPDAVILTKPAF